MDPFLARTMIESLSKGVDPLTGRVLLDPDSCAKEAIQEALETVLEHCSIESTEEYLIRLKEQRAAINREKRAAIARQYDRAGEAWTSDEEKQLLQLHQRRYNIYQIAKIMKRSPGAIASHLKQMRRQPIYRTKKSRTPW